MINLEQLGNELRRNQLERNQKSGGSDNNISLIVTDVFKSYLRLDPEEIAEFRKEFFKATCTSGTLRGTLSSRRRIAAEAIRVDEPYYNPEY